MLMQTMNAGGIDSGAGIHVTAGVGVAFQDGHLLPDLLRAACNDDAPAGSTWDAAAQFLLLRDVLMTVQRFSNARVMQLNVRFCLERHGLGARDAAARAAIQALADAAAAYLAEPTAAEDLRLRKAWQAVVAAGAQPPAC
ncbi:hypothetical protein [Caenispirillum bisanense]|uniref:hypothetical protein n=1 Tax=Caenispirillum bisanense TaxID=414052 RepID=UPI0031D02363